jgi:hypothetical protein
MEIWKDIAGYEKFYQVSNLGRVRSLDRVIISKDGKRRFFKGKVLIPNVNNSGYLFVNLLNGCRKNMLIHRLVLIAFKKNQNNLPEGNHKDGNKLNCCSDNLEWCTHQENIDHLTNELKFDRTTINSDKTGSYNWNSKSVNQLTINGELIANYGSTTEAFRETGVDFSSIQKVCLGKRKSAGGFKWEYKD